MIKRFGTIGLLRRPPSVWLIQREPELITPQSRKPFLESQRTPINDRKKVAVGLKRLISSSCINRSSRNFNTCNPFGGPTSSLSSVGSIRTRRQITERSSSRSRLAWYASLNKEASASSGGSVSSTSEGGPHRATICLANSFG